MDLQANVWSVTLKPSMYIFYLMLHKRSPAPTRHPNHPFYQPSLHVILHQNHILNANSIDNLYGIHIYQPIYHFFLNRLARKDISKKFD